jgi:mRNA interferase MazF
MTTIKRGEIWLVDLGVGNGSIQGGIRPCVVISNDMANIHSPVINVIPVTTKSKNKLPTHVTIGTEHGLLQESIAMAEQTMLVNKNSVSRRVGTLDDKTMNKLEIATLIQIGLFDKIKSVMIKNKELKNLQLARC